jgi:ribonuclease-3
MILIIHPELVLAQPLLENIAPCARLWEIADIAAFAAGPGAEVRAIACIGGKKTDAALFTLFPKLEAVIAAVYLDAGFEAAQAVVLALWGDRIAEVEADARDAKTALQEWAQARGLPPPAYLEQGRTGPDHQPVFTVEVRLENGAVERAAAGTKRQAEQAAAKTLLARMETAE